MFPNRMLCAHAVGIKTNTKSLSKNEKKKKQCEDHDKSDLCVINQQMLVSFGSNPMLDIFTE